MNSEISTVPAATLRPLTPRRKFLLVVSVFVAPFLAAWIAYAGWRPAGHTNYGDLVEVAPLNHTAGRLVDGSRLDLQALQGRWVLLRIGPAPCDRDCGYQLYLMRQIRLALGKDQGRLERLWVLAGPGRVDPALQQAHSGLHIWRPADAAFLAQFPATERHPAPLYLVDPLGNVMMRFPAHPDPRGMMRDLKLLLKASQIG